MSRFIFLLNMIAIVGCAHPSQMSVVFSDENFGFVEQVPQVGKRLIYIHGFRATHKDLIRIPEYKEVTDTLTAQGWQVVEFDLPYAEHDMFIDNGETYRQAYAAKLTQAMQWADKNLGVVDTTIIGGVSFGGLHALMGAALNPKIQGYFADVPVTHIQALGELAELFTDRFDPFYELDALRLKKGYILYGLQDERVNWRYQAQFVADMNSPTLRASPHPEFGHSIHSLKEITDWILLTF